jgi:hypothetical protein
MLEPSQRVIWVGHFYTLEAIVDEGIPLANVATNMPPHCDLE